MLASASGICPSQSALNSVRISAPLSQLFSVSISAQLSPNQRSTQSELALHAISAQLSPNQRSTQSATFSLNQRSTQSAIFSLNQRSTQSQSALYSVSYFQSQSALNSVRISRGVGQSASVDSCRPDARASRPRPATADGLELARPRRALPEVRGLRPSARAAPTSSARVLPLGMQPACPGAAARPSPRSWPRSRTRELVGPVERARCAHPGTPKGSRWRVPKPKLTSHACRHVPHRSRRRVG